MTRILYCGVVVGCLELCAGLLPFSALGQTIQVTWSCATTSWNIRDVQGYSLDWIYDDGSWSTEDFTATNAWTKDLTATNLSYASHSSSITVENYDYAGPFTNRSDTWETFTGETTADPPVLPDVQYLYVHQRYSLQNWQVSYSGIQTVRYRNVDVNGNVSDDSYTNAATWGTDVLYGCRGEDTYATNIVTDYSPEDWGYAVKQFSDRFAWDDHLTSWLDFGISFNGLTNTVALVNWWYAGWSEWGNPVTDGVGSSYSILSPGQPAQPVAQQKEPLEFIELEFSQLDE